MPDRITESAINRKATIAYDQWIEQFISPYSIAYNNAYTKFFEVLDAQNKKDQDSREAAMALTFLALSLCGGSVLTCVIGAASLKAGVAQAVLKGINGPLLDQIAKRGMDRAFTAAHFAASNKTAHFIAGGLWDHLENQASDSLKQSMMETPSNFPALKDVYERPENLKSHLQGFLSGARRRILTIVEEIVAGRYMVLPLPQDILLRKLLEAPFFTQIPRMPAKMQDRIELAMWMHFLLGLDQVVTLQLVPTGTNWSVVARKSIEVPPLSKDYPNFKRNHYHSDAHGNRQHTLVDYGNISNLISDRIDAVYRAIHGRNFFSVNEGVIFSSKEAMSKSVLVRAWRALEDMSMMQIQSAAAVWNSARASGGR